MKVVVFVPGIMGSELRLDGEKVWPPKLKEIIFGYGRINELMSDALVPRAVIDNVSVKPVYKSILNDIRVCGYSEGGPNRRLIEFPYDWRRSNSDSASKLAHALEERLVGVDEWDLRITLIGHSMGGLVLRYLLESGDFNDQWWFPRIRSLITMGTPHLGAPKALNQMCGTEGMLGVRPHDLVKLVSDSRFPSLYQLVAVEQSALVVETQPGGVLPQTVDPFSDAIAQTLEMENENIESARVFRNSIGLQNRPDHVSYYCIGGAAHKTIARMEWNTVDLEPVERRQSGDGTVPIASSLPEGIPHGLSQKKHMSIFEDREIRRQLYRFLEAPAHVVPQAADDQPVGAADSFGISVDKDEYGVGEPIELTFSYNTPANNPTETLQVVALDPDDGEPIEDAAPVGLSAELKGGDFTNLAFTIRKDFQPGLYLIKTARALDDPNPTMFTVTAEVDNG